MPKLLCLLFALFLAGPAFADPPKAGTYFYETPTGKTEPGSERTLNMAVSLTKMPSGDFALDGHLTIDFGDNRKDEVYFKGILTTHGVVRGTASTPIGNGELDKQHFTGSWNPSSNKLQINVPGQGAILLSRLRETNAERGYYALTKTDVGSQPLPYQGWTGILDATTLKETDKDPGTHNDVATLTGTWNAPPSKLVPGESYTLTGSATAEFAKGFHEDVGMTVRWVLSGDVADVKIQKAFAGYADSGQLSTEVNGECTFKVGHGGDKIVIAMVGGGSIGRNPCVYTYIWKPANK